MILLRSILLLLFLTCSCNQIMIREYESEFKSSFFRDADCRRVAAHSFIFSKDHTSYTIDKTSITHKTNDQVVWTKDINVLCPFQHTDLVVAYMLRDGMTKAELFQILGKNYQKNGRLYTYSATNNGTIKLFDGSLNLPKGMKSITIIQDNSTENFQFPLLLE